MEAVARWGRQRLPDVVFSVVLTAVGVASLFTRDPSSAYSFPPPSIATVVLAGIGGLTLSVRRRWALSTCLIATSAIVAIAVLGRDASFASFFLLIVVYTVAAERGLRPAVVGLAYLYACIGLLLALRVPYFDHPLGAMFAAFITAAWLFGRWIRRQRHHREAALARALEAERIRMTYAERAVLAERLHIARELHDVVADTLSVISVQSAAARRRLERENPAGRAVAAMAAIETASRTALHDLRRMLGVLRADPELDDFAPVPAATGPARPSAVREWLIDATVAVVLAALGTGAGFIHDPAVIDSYPAPSGVMIALTLLSCLPLAARRRWPVAVLATTVVALIATAIAGWNSDWAGLAAYLALYTVAAWRSLPLAVGGLAAVGLGDVMIGVLGAPHYAPGGEAAGALVPFVLGLAVGRWRRDRDVAAARATEATRTRAAAAERAVFAERLRIAQELHDVVSHTLSAVAVQAAVARHQVGKHAPATAALAAIEQASRSAMTDLRRMLGILQADDLERPGLSPLPGLDQLDLLISAHRATHGPVEFAINDAARSAPDSLQLTMFRLVQEALTNVRKHAPGARTQVRITAAADGVEVEIENAQAVEQPSNATTGGFGLAGMRERAALFGGQVDAAPLPHGGFRVTASLPTGDRTVAV